MLYVSQTTNQLTDVIQKSRASFQDSEQKQLIQK